MSDQDDNSTDKSSGGIDPANIYRLYRATRRASVEATKHQSSPITQDPTMEDRDMSTNTTADIAYRGYRESRESDHSQAIDSILSEINMEQSRNTLLLELEKQPSIESGTSLGTTLGNVFSLPGKLLKIATGQSDNAANDENGSLFRGVIPLAAAAMLALVVVPFVILNSPDDSVSVDQLAAASNVPESLLRLSDDAVNFVAPVSAASVGFTSDLSPSAEFMNLGATVTDLVVAQAAESDDYQQQTRAALERILANNQVGSVNSELSALIAEVNSQSDQHAELTIAVASLSESVQRQHKEDGLSEWYALGQSLEALNLSAGLIIEGQDGVPLQEALKNHRALFPQESKLGDDPRINSLLQEIRMVSDDESDLLNSARQIDVAVDKINLLMN